MHKSPAKMQRDRLRRSDTCLDCGAELPGFFIPPAAYCDDCKQRRYDRRLMWKFAHQDGETGETITRGGPFRIHTDESLDVLEGDVLVQRFKYAHPALTTRIREKSRDPHSRGSWTELIDRLPKRKQGLMA